jgi:hypothetical protein
VQLVEIENSLPNGFHDAFLESVDADYISGRVLIKLRLCIGDPDASTEKAREAYKSANLELLDLVYLVIEAPDPSSKHAEIKGLWIDGGEAKPESDPPMPVPVEFLPRGAFAYWFFVRNWNSFIHVAAMDARFHWSSEDVSPSTPPFASKGWASKPNT